MSNKTPEPSHTAIMCDICLECLCRGCKDHYTNQVISHDTLVKACELGLNNTIAADETPELAIDLTKDIETIKFALALAGKKKIK